MVKKKVKTTAEKTKANKLKEKKAKAYSKLKASLNTKGKELLSKLKEPTLSAKKAVSPGAFKTNLKKPSLVKVSVPTVLPKPTAPKLSLDRKYVTKYEYGYGIKEIQIDYVEYGDKGIYVSKPINVNGNVVEVSLDAVEEHPVLSSVENLAAGRQTSIEYYIASTGTNKNPGLEDWYPILPDGQKNILSEFLLFSGNIYAKLRFPAHIGESATIYKDGVALKSNEWIFVESGKAIQLTKNRKTSSVYTIDYKPNEDMYNPWNVDIYQKAGVPVKTKELFKEGTNYNKTIVLENYPFVNYEKINKEEEYEPFNVSLRNASIIGKNRKVYKEVFSNNEDEVYTLNKTDYKNNNTGELKKYSIVDDEEHNVFEYKQEGSKLIFTETFNKADMYTNYEDSHGNAEVEVEYEYLSSEFRVKVIMRKMSNNTMSLTPILHEYSLNFKTIK